MQILKLNIKKLVEKKLKQFTQINQIYLPIFFVLPLLLFQIDLQKKIMIINK